MIDKQGVGDRIAVIRKNLGYSQPAFAEKLDVTTQAVSKWETGLSLPALETLLSISWISGISINTILDGDAFLDKTSGIDRGLLRMNELLVCPRCGEKLTLNMLNRDNLYYECPNGHRYPVIEGVIDFNTREINGELWSLYYKNYEQYLEMHDSSNINPNFMRGKPIHQLMGDKILELKPRIILDIASGAGSCVEFYLPRIHWPCTVILTDLSHRILKWDRQYFMEEIHNPYVDLVFMACDCAVLPFIGSSVDCVTSLAGFESMQAKQMDGFREGYRVLRPGGNTVYTMALIEGGGNSEKWVSLMREDEVLPDDRLRQAMVTVEEWLSTCETAGYTASEALQIYGELPAPETNHIPFRNELFQWMAEYLMVSKKAVK